MVTGLLITNALVLLFLTTREYLDTWRSRVLVFVWAGGNVALFGLLFVFQGATRLSLTFPGVELPWFVGWILLATVLVLPLGRTGGRQVRLVTALVMVILYAISRRPIWMSQLAMGSGTHLEQLLLAFMSVMVLLVSVYCPLTWFNGEDKTTTIRRLFYPRLSEVGTHLKPVLTGALASVVTVLVFTRLLTDQWVAVNHFPTVRVFIIWSVMVTFYWVVLVQFVSVGLVKSVMDRLLPEETSYWEIVVFVVVAAVVNLGLPHWMQMLRECVLVAIAGFLYLRTSTLFYGIAIRSLIAVVSC